jgi:predicted alpha/beta-hydrolase family hydrolase
LSRRPSAGTISRVTTIDIDTPHGPARAHLHPAENARAALMLGHGAGGGVNARDLVAVKDVALSLGISVALVEQPYRVAGRRAPPRAPQLDAAWIAVVDHLRVDAFRDLALIAGGRSSGARVACRTAEATAAIAVLCLAFPLQPPRREGSAPAPSRLPELDAVPVPVLVLQGSRDPFGMPAGNARRTVVVLAGDHSLRTDIGSVAANAESWLRAVSSRASRS